MGACHDYLSASSDRLGDAARITDSCLATGNDTSLICHTEGSLGRSLYVIQLGEKPQWLTGAMKPIVNMESPDLGEMTVQRSTGTRIDTSIRAELPGHPAGVLTVTLQRGDGSISLDLSKNLPQFGAAMGVDYLVFAKDDLLGRDEGHCAPFHPQF